MIAKAIKKDKYILSTVIISLAVAVLIHFPESVSLFDRFESHSLFPGMKFIDVANEILFTFLSLLLLFAINTRLFHFNQASIKITGTKILLSFIVTWILSNLSGQFFVFLHRTFDIPAIDAMVHHYLHPLRDFIVACLVTSSCCIIHLIFKQQLVLIENEQLFNSLNTLRSLVRENQDKAQDYIQELSRVLRYTLQSNESQCVSLREEIEFVSAYIFLLKMRFENNLQFDIQISNAYEEYLLPPMAVQVLIENAVKHNEISNRKPLTIHITTDDNGNLSISNDIQPKWTATSGTGIGLANLAKRYRLLFKRDIQITEDREFTVCIPLIEKSQLEQ